MRGRSGDTDDIPLSREKETFVFLRQLRRFPRWTSIVQSCASNVASIGIYGSRQRETTLGSLSAFSVGLLTPTIIGRFVVPFKVVLQYLLHSSAEII